jgi:hypothetical protein
VIPTKPLLRPVGNRKGGNSPGRLGTAQNRSRLSRTLSRLPHPPKRPAVLWGVVTLALLAARATVANAAYQGSDLWGNLTAGGPAAGPLMTRHPLGAFDLDYHVDTGIGNLDGVPASIAQFLASTLWLVSKTAVWLTLQFFNFAFSLDLVNGRHGALAPVSRAVQDLQNTITGDAWLTCAIIVAGIWGTWKALGQRRYTEAFTGLALSVACVIAAMLLIYRPADTIGQATSVTNQISAAILGGDSRGGSTDRLFDTLIYRPWVALEFGGLKHCVGRRTTRDGFPVPVAPDDPARTVCRDHIHPDSQGRGGYAERFLAYPVGSMERNDAYSLLKSGGQAQSATTFPGWTVDRADPPGVDAMQQGGAYQRLGVAIVVCVLVMGAVVTLGTLAVGIILAQLAALFLLVFAPFALLAGAIPGWGFRVFEGWGRKLFTAVAVKVIYTIALTAVLTVSAALESATSGLGFFWGFALVGLFYWTLFVKRGAIVQAVSGGHAHTVLEPVTHAGRYARRTIDHAPTPPLPHVHRPGGTTTTGGTPTTRHDQKGTAAVPAPTPSTDPPSRPPTDQPATRVVRRDEPAQNGQPPASNWHLVEIGDRTTSGRHNNGSEAQDPPRPVNGRENAPDAPVSGYTFRARPVDPPPPPTTGETP